MRLALCAVAICALGALLAACGSGSDSSGTATAPTPTAAAPAKPTNVYWGAWIGDQFEGEGAPFDMNAVTEFEDITKKPLSLINFSSPFADCSTDPCNFYEFPTEEMENVRSYGAIPIFSWASNSTPTTPSEPNFRLSNVTNGTYDSYIREWAEGAKAWGHPFFLRFNWEMNGNWFPWAEAANENAPGDFVAAWRHVHDIFARVGATDVSWVWCPNVDPEEKLTDLASLYPGDEYVDWTCLDGYNWGPGAKPPRPWRSFHELFYSTYRRITDEIAPSKPMLIGETASSEIGGSKAGWIQAMFKSLATEFPRIRGLTWFDKEEDGVNWTLESSQAAGRSFAAGIGAKRYLGNSFAGLHAAPIPAP